MNNFSLKHTAKVISVCFATTFPVMAAAEPAGQTEPVPALTWEGYDASPERARVRPGVIFEPGPEYGDDFRRFQGIPGIEVAGNGRLWATWYSGGDTEGNYNYVVLVTSGDRGETWSDLKLVIDPDWQGTVEGFDAEVWSRHHRDREVRQSGPTRAYDPMLWRDPNGKLWLFWAQNSGGYWGTPATWAMVTENPEADNPEWSEPFYIADGVLMNKPTVLKRGDWLFPFAYWKQEPSAVVLATSDQGKTWQFRGGAVIPDAEHRNADEHMIIERGDGSLWMLIRAQYGIGQSFSEDGGYTWTPAAQSDIMHSMSRFFIRRLSSGNLLLVKHGELNEPVGTVRNQLTAFLSTDDGQTWQGRLRLREGTSSYPDGVEDDAGNIYVIYDISRRGHKEIRMAAFNEQDLLAGEGVSAAYKMDTLINKAHGVNFRGLDRAENRDGADFVADLWATLSPLNGEIDSLERDVQLFSDRSYLLHHVPSELVGRNFIRAAMDGVTATVTQPGYIVVLTPNEGRNKAGLQQELLADGFVKVNLPESLLFMGRNNICTAYQKKVAAGDVIQVNKWGVLVF